MKKNDLEKLRSYYHSLRGQQRVFEEERAAHAIENGPVQVLADELSRLEADFPGLVPPFKADVFFRHHSSSVTFYNTPGIRSHLGMVLGKLQVAIESPDSTPVTETREFPFVKDARLRTILERDYSEIQRAFIATCWKSVIVLAGGAIEAILTDLLLQHPKGAKAASKASQKPDITAWDLADLINVCVELKLVSTGIERLSHPVREYRNLVHPGNELRNKLTFGPEEAKIALEVLHILHRDLSK